jgi:hypothetical protein
MSTQPTPPAPAPQKTVPSDEREIRIIEHSQLFYWWPVWAVGFIMAAITYFTQEHLVVLPSTAVASATAPADSSGKDGSYSVTVKNAPIPKEFPKDANGQYRAVTLADKDSPYPTHISSNKNFGVIFMMVLLLVIVITNVPLRGMWSVVVIVCVVLISIILWLADVWEVLLNLLGGLHIYMNMGGYLFLSLALLIIWVVTVFLFDRQTYMIFTPGQLKVREQIGGGEVAYDTRGMVIQHLRDDVFRHWILGLGSGDLIVRTAGAHSHEFRMSNVLFVGRKLQQIEEMQRDVPIVSGTKT